MRYSRFLLFSLFGGIFWIAFMTTVGFQLGQIPIVRRNFEKVVIGIVVISVVPVVLEARRKAPWPPLKDQTAPNEFPDPAAARR